MQVNIWGRNSSRNASVDYMYGVVEDHPQYLRDISPYLQVTGGQTVKEGRDTYRYTGVYGVNEDYTAMANYTMADGRGLQYMDIKENKYVCVIGDYLAREAFNGNAVGEDIKVGAYRLRSWACWPPRAATPSCRRAARTTASTSPTPWP